MWCCFIANSFHFLHHLLQTSLGRVIGDGGLLGGKVDVGVYHARYFFESLFDAHGAGGAGHTLKIELGVTLGAWLNRRRNGFFFYRTIYFCSP